MYIISMNHANTIAVFDFDGTLVKGDSLWPFLLAAAGAVDCALGLAEGALRLASRRDDEDSRTAVKSALLERTLRGKTVEELKPALAALRHWSQWKDDTVARLRAHHAAGHHVVIASGGLDLYLPSLLADLPHHALICTAMEVKDGSLTGRMASGNCVRRKKAEMVAEHMAAREPFADSWGYGNYPHDIPMMELMKNRVVV